MKLHSLLSAAIIGTAPAQITFGPSHEVSDAMSSGILFAEATDMDGDGDLDMAAAERSGVRVLWWENDGSGNFDIRHEWIWGDLDDTMIGFEDWNGDELVDIWVEENWGYTEETLPRILRVAVNQGDGSFSSPLTIGELDRDPEEFFLQESCLIDLDGDGLRDVVKGNRIYWHRTGSELQSEPTRLPSDDFGVPVVNPDNVSSALSCDFDGDGDIDIISKPILYNRSQLIQNLGTSYASPTPLLHSDPDAINPIRYLDIIDSSTGPIVWAIEKNKVTDNYTALRYAVTSGGTVDPKEPTPLPNAIGETAIHWIDIKAINPHTAIGSASSYSPFVTHFFAIDASTQAASVTPIFDVEGVAECRLVQFADLNGDSHADLAFPLSELGGTDGSTRSRIEWLPADPGGAGFVSSAKTIMSGIAHPTVYAFGNLDGSGVTKILLGSSRRSRYPPKGNDRLTLLSPDVPGQPWHPIDIPIDRDRFEIIAEVDLEGDFQIGTEATSHNHNIVHCPNGRADFLIQTFDKPATSNLGLLRFEWLLQDYSGQFHLKEVAQEKGTDLVSARYIDWDGDTIPDLIHTSSTPPHYYSSQTFIRRGLASEFSSADLLSPLALDLTVIRDVDWDGDPDLVLNRLNSPLSGFASSWVENDGTGSIASIRGLSDTAVPIPGDFNQDGHDDYVYEAYGRNGVLLARPGLTFESVGNLAEGLFGSLLDLDDDGDLDILIPYFPQGFAGFASLHWRENRGNSYFSGDDSHPPGELVAPARSGERNQLLMSDIDGDQTPDLIVASSNYHRLEWFKITTAPEPEAFTTWMAGSGLSGNSAGPSSDWDLDGVSNWQEFAFGSNAAAPDSHHLGRPRLEVNPSGLNYTFQRRIDASSLGVTYDMFRSEDLVTWEPWTPSETTEATGSGYERVRFTIAPGGSNEFFKTRVPDPGEP